jgi:uncharacterized protein (PEP-CTERM system associated)
MTCLARGSRRPVRNCLATIDNLPTRHFAQSTTAVAVVLLLVGAPATADEWRVEPGGSPTISYSDNVALAAPGKEQSSLILGIAPRISFTGKGSRYTVAGRYELSAYFYSNAANSSRYYSNLNLFGNVEAVKRFFFVEGGAFVFQNFISPLGPITVTNSLQTGNRTTTYVYQLNPYIQSIPGAETTYLLRLNNTWTDYSSSALRGSYIANGIGNIGRPSGPGRRYGWQAEYNGSYVNYNNQQPFTLHLGRGILSYQVNPDFQVSARGGYEQNNYAIGGYSGSIYGAGLDWRPTPRTILNGFWEHRFFGDSYRANFQHRTRLTGWRLTGSRGITTSTQQLQLGTGIAADVVDAAFISRVPDPVQRQQEVQKFLDQSGLPQILTQPIAYYNNEILLQDRVEAAFSLFGGRNSLVLTAYWSDQEPITGAGTPLPASLNANLDYAQRGASATYTHQLTGTASLSFLALRNYTQYRSTFIPGSTDYTLLRGLFTARIGASTSWFAGLRYQWRDVSNPPYTPYREAAVFGGLDYAYR